TMCKVLIFGCIAAVILMTAAYGASLGKPTPKQQRLEASITDLELLKHIDNNFLDFYTPNDKRECNHTTLACFLKELNVLKQDVEEEDMRHVINIEKNLEESYHQSMKFSVLQDPDFSNPTCKKCESNEKKKFAEFHREMTSFLQSMQK
ncbi:IL15 protein, partial [Buphagus erythrorhynchus]|nr:IL15 protein [Buphagus erythrorhynchus]